MVSYLKRKTLLMITEESSHTTVTILPSTYSNQTLNIRLQAGKMPKKPKSPLKICCVLTCYNCFQACCFPYCVCKELNDDSFEYRPFRKIVCASFFTILGSILCCPVLPCLYAQNECIKKRRCPPTAESEYEEI